MTIDDLKSAARTALEEITSRSAEDVDDNTVVSQEFALDSLDYVEFMLTLEEELDVPIKESYFPANFQEQNFGDLADHLYDNIEN